MITMTSMEATTAPAPKITLKRDAYFDSMFADDASRYDVFADGEKIGWVTKPNGDKFWSAYYNSFGETGLAAGWETTRKWAVHKVCVNAIGYRGYLD